MTTAAPTSRIRVRPSLASQNSPPSPIPSRSSAVTVAPGVVIIEINRKPITSEADYRSIVAALKPGDDVVFVIRDPKDPSRGDSYVGGTLQ